MRVYTDASVFYADCYFDLRFSFEFVENVTLYATWHDPVKYTITFNNNYDETIPASRDLNNRIIQEAGKENVKLRIGNILCSENFYCCGKEYEKPEEHDCLGVEMESFALFANAVCLNKRAACIVTISDIVGKDAEISAEERQNSLDTMIKLALNSVE